MDHILGGCSCDSRREAQQPARTQQASRTVRTTSKEQGELHALVWLSAYPALPGSRFGRWALRGARCNCLGSAARMQRQWWGG